jgi:hypothetical protein
MMKLQDAVYNWLTIKVVADARKDDEAAQETEQFFACMLKEDYKVEEIAFKKENEMYMVTLKNEEGSKQFRFPAELIETMLEQINREPEKYVNYKSHRT